MATSNAHGGHHHLKAVVAITQVQASIKYTIIYILNGAHGIFKLWNIYGTP